MSRTLIAFCISLLPLVCYSAGQPVGDPNFDIVKVYEELYKLNVIIDDDFPKIVSSFSADESMNMYEVRKEANKASRLEFGYFNTVLNFSENQKQSHSRFFMKLNFDIKTGLCRGSTLLDGIWYLQDARMHEVLSRIVYRRLEANYGLHVKIIKQHTDKMTKNVEKAVSSLIKRADLTTQKKIIKIIKTLKLDDALPSAKDLLQDN